MSVGIQRLRDEADRVRLGAIDKGEDPAVVDRALELDLERRGLIAQIDHTNAERNRLSKEIAEAIRRGTDPTSPEITQLKDASREASAGLDGLAERLAVVETELDDALLRIPNPADPDVPVGDEEANVVVRTWGTPLPREDRRPHW